MAQEQDLVPWDKDDSISYQAPTRKEARRNIRFHASVLFEHLDDEQPVPCCSIPVYRLTGLWQDSKSGLDVQVHPSGFEHAMTLCEENGFGVYVSKEELDAYKADSSYQPKRVCLHLECGFYCNGEEAERPYPCTLGWIKFADAGTGNQDYCIPCCPYDKCTDCKPADHCMCFDCRKDREDK